MLLRDKRAKNLIIIILLGLLILAKDHKVFADSKSLGNTKEQIQFLEEKRKSQNERLRERQKNTIVEGMLSSRDIENRLDEEVENKDEIKREQKDEEDTLSKVIKSIRRFQIKNRESKEALERENLDKKEDEARYYKNTKIPIVEDRKLEAVQASFNEKIENIVPEKIKDLIDRPLPDREPVDMNYSDREMLERIVMAESGGEPYLGQIAVANVVLNRVKSNRYPSTLEGVIFQKSQFSPVKNGVIRGREPNESVKKAVSEALAGRMIVAEDTLYFVNPVLATDQTIPRTKTPVKVIGSHTFYK